MKRPIYFFPLFLLPCLLIFICITACQKQEGETASDHYEELRKNVPEPYKAFVNPFGDGSTIGAMLHLVQDVILLFDETGTRYAWYEDKRIQGVFALKDSAGPLRQLYFIDSVECAVNWTLAGDYSMAFLFGKSTNHESNFDYIFFYYSRSQFDNYPKTMPPGFQVLTPINGGPIDYFLSPFVGRGFGAAAEYVKPYAGDTVIHMFNLSGDRYARNDLGTAQLGPVTAFSAWGGNNNLFPAVAAAALIELDGIKYNIFISKDGSKLGAWHLAGNTSVFEGPWQIN